LDLTAYLGGTLTGDAVFMVSFLAKPQTCIVTPAPGWSDLVRLEIQEILDNPLQKYKFAPEVQVKDSSILVTNCDYRQVMEVVRRATLIHDVELVLHSSRVITRMGWRDFFLKSKIGEVWPALKTRPLQLTVRVSHPVVGTEKEVKERLKEFLEEAGFCVMGYQNATDEASVGRLRLESQKNRTQMLISMAGLPLYKRSYKDVLSGAAAPLPEHHAAACFRWAIESFGSDFQRFLASGSLPIVIPFAGTGTLGFEAICQLGGCAPGIFRSDYSFKNFLFHPTKTGETINKRLLTRIHKVSPRVIFGELDSRAHEDLGQNIAGFERRMADVFEDTALGKISSLRNDFLHDADKLFGDEKEIFLMLNPPYGERLAKKTGGQTLYGQLGRVVKKLSQKIKISGVILCGDELSWRQFISQSGIEQHKTRHFTHGGIDVRALVFSTDRDLSLP
jgi:23S rRNA G2445 N2-methylase RlmL